MQVACDAMALRLLRSDDALEQFSFAKLFLSFLALGDVENRSDHVLRPAVGVPHHGAANINPKGRAVLAYAPLLNSECRELARHHSPVEVLLEGYVVRMSDVAHTELEQFLARVSCEAAVLVIDTEVGLPVGRCFHDANGSVRLRRAQPLPAFPQRRSGLLEFRGALGDAPF